MVIWRFMDDGTPDKSFGTNGVVVEANPNSPTLRVTAQGLAVDRKGRIVVVGVTSGSLGNDIIVVRLLSDGTFDKSFGGTGVGVYSAAEPSDDEVTSVSIDQYDRIITCGYSDVIGPFVLRITPEGNVDSTFGSSGVVSLGAPRSGSDYEVLAKDDGSILVVGESSGHMSVWKLLSDGSFDPSFGTNGVTSYSSGSVGNAIGLDSSGRITVTGRVEAGVVNLNTTYDLAIWRYRSDGTLDTTFGQDGVATHPVSSGSSYFCETGTSVVAGDQSGGALVAGSGCSGEYLILWRYIP